MNPKSNNSNSAVARAQLQKLIAAGMEHHNSGRHDWAETCYRQALRIAPVWSDLHNNLASTLQAQGKLPAAIESYQQAVQLSPENNVARHNLACLLYKSGQHEQAAAHFRIVVSIDPRHAQASCNLANILAANGQISEAMQLYESALRIDPESAEACTNLGNLCKSRGDHARAEQLHRRAIGLKPDFAEAHNNLGCVLLEALQPERASACFRRALVFKPDYAEALCNLGVALKDQGLFQQAIECFTEVQRQRPGNPETLNNCAGALRDSNRPDAALEHCDRAILLQPDFAAAHCTRGSILQDLGRFADAESAFRKSLDLRAENPQALYNLAQLKTFRADDSDLKHLESIEPRSESWPPAKRAFIHFALGKAYDDTRQFDLAFAHFSKGNALWRSLIRYDEAATLDHLRLTAEVFNASFLGRFRGSGDPSPAPIFIVGMPRTGSTLVEQILASHPSVSAGGELMLLPNIANNPPGHAGVAQAYPACYSSLDIAAFTKLGNAYLQGIPPLPADKLRITDKLPGNFIHLGLIHLILPNAIIIHTVRNPADTCLSCFSKLFTAGVPYSRDLHELARYFKGYLRLMNHWRSVLPGGKILDVCYEDLVNDLQGQSRRIVAHCGLPWDDRCLNFHTTRRAVATASNVSVRQPIYQSSLARWRNYQKQLQPLIDEL